MTEENHILDEKKILEEKEEQLDQLYRQAMALMIGATIFSIIMVLFKSSFALFGFILTIVAMFMALNADVSTIAKAKALIWLFVLWVIVFGVGNVLWYR